ncbi:MAG: hypothetical protein QXP31_03650 [Pyrobaculum sp.]|uniref:hypothetical protein n=1 Tax=Pyrobaculum sp. TaxID=2004705 RepID=UPI0031618ABA
MRAGWALLAFAAFCLAFVRGLVATAPFLLYVNVGVVAQAAFAAGVVLFAALLALGAGSSWLGARGVVWPFFAFLAALPFGFVSSLLATASFITFDSSAYLWYIPAAMFFVVFQLITALYYAKLYKATGVEEFRRAGRYVVIGAFAAALFFALLTVAIYGDVLAAKTAFKKALGK